MTFGPIGFSGTSGQEVVSLGFGFNKVPNTSTTDGQFLIASSGTDLRVNSPAGTAFGMLQWADQGADASNTSYIAATAKSGLIAVNAFCIQLCLRNDPVVAHNLNYNLWLDVGRKLNIGKTVSGGLTILRTGTTNVSSGDVIALQATGPAATCALTAYLNGAVEIASFTDGSFGALRSNACITNIQGSGHPDANPAFDNLIQDAGPYLATANALLLLDDIVDN